MRNSGRFFNWLLATLYALLFLGSVFIVSAQNYDLFDTYRKYWTIVLGLLFVMSIALGVFVTKGKMELPVDAMLKTVFVTGILESLYAIAQFFKILPTHNRYYTYTGSFDNPAVFAMLLSVCIPIAVYYASKEGISTKVRWQWRAGALALLIFICFSESRSGLIASLLASLIVLLAAYDVVRRKLFNKRTLLFIIPLAIVMLYLLYRFKADSANGRLLMWRVCLDMIKERPLLGFGYCGFTTFYMDYQANYLSCNPDSPFILLADNVNNPFNEYLLVLVHYGLVGFSVLLCLIIALFRKLRLQKRPYSHLAIGLMAALMVWSFFSYPFSMPFVWVIAMLIMIITFFPFVCKHYRPVGATLLIVGAIGIIIAVHHYKPEREWKEISQRSLMGETETVLPDYGCLYEHLKYNCKFLYNYGAELHFSHHYNESIVVLEECSKNLNDYDVQMLIGDCHQNLGDTVKAIEHYNYAGRMVPSKFMPQYYIMNLYLARGDTLNAINTANVILAKDVKVDRSKAVQRIIREAQAIVMK